MPPPISHSHTNVCTLFPQLLRHIHRVSLSFPLLRAFTAGGKAVIILWPTQSYDCYKPQSEGTHTHAHSYKMQSEKQTGLRVCVTEKRGVCDVNSSGWWECRRPGQWLCFAYVIAAMGRGLHMLLEPPGSHSACFIIGNSRATLNNTIGFIPKQIGL